MFPGEIPGRSRLELLGRRRGMDRVFRKVDIDHATNVYQFYHGSLTRAVRRIANRLRSRDRSRHTSPRTREDATWVVIVARLRLRRSAVMRWSQRQRSPLPVCSLSEKIERVYEGMQIEWGTRAIRDMRRLAERDRERIIAKIEQYAESPASLASQVAALTGSDYRRLRVGNHRVIFTTQHGEPSTLIVLRVRHRREAYD